MTNGLPCQPYSNVLLNTFPVTHSNTFIDLTGDCRADLFIVSQDTNQNIYLETWVKEPNGLFCLADVTQFNYNYTTFSFEDFDGDGSFDFSFMETSLIMHQVYNLQSGSANSPCANSYMGPVFNGYNAATTTTNATVYNVINTAWPSYSLLAGKSLYSYDPVNRPSILRFGDVNRDGYPDLLLTLIDSTYQIPQTYLFVNQDCSQLTGFSSSTRISRCYQPDTTNYGVNFAQNISYYAAFFDFDEIGSMGMLVIADQNQITQSNKTNLLAVFNFVETDCFFLKALVVNSIGPNPTFSSVYYGSSFECEVSDLSGNKRLVKSNQLQRASFAGLQLPFCYVGLNRTNNYVENFVVGISINGSNTYQWTPIIPNSQLIVFTSPPSIWTLDIFVNPTKETGIIIVTTVIILILLGLLIIYYHVNEKEQDKKEAGKHIWNLG